MNVNAAAEIPGSPALKYQIWLWATGDIQWGQQRFIGEGGIHRLTIQGIETVGITAKRFL